MIKKKLGKIMFGWDPNAYKGRGYWYVLGRDDSLARAASKGEATKLGRPKDADMPAKDAEKQKYYFAINPKTGKPMRKRYRTSFSGDETGPSEYETADITRSKSVMQLASERMLSGQGMGGSLKGAISDKMKARATNMKRMFDPMNILSKIPGVGKLAATAYGMKRGRSAADISYFTGVHAPDRLHDDQPETGGGIMSKLRGGSKTEKVKTTGSGAGPVVAAIKQLHQLIQDKIEEDKKLREVDDAFAEEQKSEADKKHKELIDAILKGKKPKDKKEPKKEEKSIFDIFKNMIIDKFLPMLQNFGGGLMKLLGSLGGILGPLALVVGGVVAGAKVIDKGYEAVTGKSSDSYNKLYDPSTTDKDMQDYIKQRQYGGITDKATETSQAKDMEQYKKTGKITDITGKDVTKERLGQIEKFKKYKEFKKNDPYQQYKEEVEKKDYKGKKRPTFEEWKASKGLTPKSEATATKVPDQMSYSEQQSYETIGGQPIIEGQPLNATQMAAAKMSMSLGNKLSPVAQKSYDLAIQGQTQQTQLSQRMNAATSENQNLTGVGSEGTSPVIINKTNNVVNNGGISGGGGSASIRNDEPVLNRLQYQSVRPV